MGIQPALGNNYDVEEDDLGAFLQGDFKFEIGPGTLRGNVGVRYVETEQTSKGYTFTSGSPLQTEVTRNYDDMLPSLNLVYDFSDSLLMRIGAAKVMTRPNLGQLNPGSSVSVSGNSRTVTAGNPDLEPFRADAYDLGVRMVFRPRVAAVGRAVLQGHRVVRADDPRDSARSPATRWACRTAWPSRPAARRRAAARRPTGTSASRPTRRAATLQGYEIAYQQPFSFLPGAWSNFGAILNYTGVEVRDRLPECRPVSVIATDDDSRVCLKRRTTRRCTSTTGLSVRASRRRIAPTT